MASVAEVQLDLLADPAPTAPIVVEPTPDVILRGAGAAAVPRHVYVPSPCPKSMHTDEEWLLVLLVAERCIRWRSWTQPHPLPLEEKPSDCVGGASGTWHDSKGVAVGDRRYVSWAALLRGLREQRAHEPDIARARDLAHAYHALDQYDRFYLRDVDEDDDWREQVAVPYLAELRGIVEELGGHPEPVLAGEGEEG